MVVPSVREGKNVLSALIHFGAAFPGAGSLFPVCHMRESASCGVPVTSRCPGDRGTSVLAFQPLHGPGSAGRALKCERLLSASFPAALFRRFILTLCLIDSVHFLSAGLARAEDFPL